MDMNMRLPERDFGKSLFFYIRMGLMVVLLFYTISSSQAVDPNIDVMPMGFMADIGSPIAIHYTIVTSAFSGYSWVTAKVRILSGYSPITANNYTWATGLTSWRNDWASLGTLPVLPVSNNTVSGWFFMKSLTNTTLGISTCTLRFYKTSVTYIDITAVSPIYAWNSTSDAGWLAGTYSGGSNMIVLAMDSINQILGSYITESNGINEGYQNTSGYFKLAVPTGKVARLEFWDLNNAYVSSLAGPWTITANSVTSIPKVTGISPENWIHTP